MSRTILHLLLPLAVVLCTQAWGALVASILGLVAALALHGWLQVQIGSAVRPTKTAELLDLSPREPGPAEWSDPVQTVRARCGELTHMAERAGYERVRGNLRSVALAELWRAVSDDDPDRILFEGVHAFCGRELGQVDIALLRLDPRAQEISGAWARTEGVGGRRTNVRWALASLEGSLARALRTAHTVVAGSGGDVPIRVSGERPRITADTAGHVVVPLVAPAPRPECRADRWLYREGCPAHRPHPDAVTRARTPAQGRGIELGSCGTCAHFPVHGALLVGQRTEEAQFTPVTVHLLETLAGVLASVLEHAALYREIKGAERFRDQVLDAMMNGLVSTDQHGRIVYANQRAREILGDEALIGRRLDECLALPGGSGALTRTLLEGHAYLQADGAALVPDGEGTVRRLPVRLNLTPFRPEDGGVSGAVCVLEDRSTLRAMEQEIRHLDTLAAIGRFASSLAHEVRNPLGGIQAGIEYIGRSLQRAELLDDDTRENLDVIRGEITRIDDILRNLLSVARPREIVLTECDPVTLVGRAVRTFEQLAASREIELRAHVAGGLGAVNADADMIHQVLINLLKNAIEASAPRARVEVVATVRRDPTGEEPADGIAIEVLDRGSGISEEDLPRIFEPFYTRKSNGTGLGLYVCHGFVRRHDGRLWAENRKGGGARFVLELPRIPALMGVSR